MIKVLYGTKSIIIDIYIYTCSVKIIWMGYKVIYVIRRLGIIKNRRGWMGVALASVVIITFIK